MSPTQNLDPVSGSFRWMRAAIWPAGMPAWFLNFHTFTPCSQPKSMTKVGSTQGIANPDQDYQKRDAKRLPSRTTWSAFTNPGTGTRRPLRPSNIGLSSVIGFIRWEQTTSSFLPECFTSRTQSRSVRQIRL